MEINKKGGNMYEYVKEIKEKYQREFLTYDNVEGIGVGKIGGEYCIRVYTSGDVDLPDELEGVKVDIKYSGKIEEE